MRRQSLPMFARMQSGRETAVTRAKGEILAEPSIDQVLLQYVRGRLLVLMSIGIGCLRIRR